MNNYIILQKIDNHYFMVTDLIVGWKNAFTRYKILCKRIPSCDFVIMQYKVGAI